VPAEGVAAATAQTGTLALSIAAIHTAAAAQKTHRPSAAVIASAQAAAVEPVTEQRRAAAAWTIGRLDQVEPAAMARDSIRATLRAAIAGATPAPKTEADAEKLISGGAKEASEALRGQLADARAAADGPLKGAAASEVAPASQPVPGPPPLALEAAPPPPAVPDAAFAVPGPAPAGQPDCSAHEAEASRPLVEGGVSEAQLARGSEPAFRLALDARAKAGAHSHGVGARYRKIESGIREQTLGMAERALASDLGGMHDVRGTRGAVVGAHQLAAKARDAAARQQITAKITQTKDRTRADVDRILEPLEKEASTCFEAGLKRAEEAYAAAFSEARGGFGTWLSTWGEAWRSHIEAALTSARSVYMQHVDAAIEAVASYVDEQLARARRRVQEGRKEVERDIGGLDANLRQFGAEALEAVSAEFDAMAGQIDARRDGLVDRLAQQYKSSLERMDTAEQGLRDENRGLWERARAATLGVVEQVLAFKAMLLGLLAEAAAVVGDIIANPIGFLRNLVAGIGLGLRNFLANIGSHLKKGLMEWIFGVLSGAGVQMPDSFDLKGIASIVMQVMGLTYANIRARAVAIVGEKVVSGLEKTAEVFKIVITEGIPGLWQLIKDKLTDLKSMVLDGIFSFIHEKVIVAGITWIVSLLNPASAFFKACKAIYDIVSFFVERGAQLAALAKAVIASVGAIARGAIGTAANWIETSLARAIPMAIGFLAGLLGLGDISGTIRKLIDKAQAPVNKAVDWVVRLAVKGAEKISTFFRRKDEKKSTKKEDPASKWESAKREIISKVEQSNKESAENRRSIEENASIWKEKYGFTSLKLIRSGTSWKIVGSMSPEREITAGKEEYPQELSDLIPEMEYFFPESRNGEFKVGFFQRLEYVKGTLLIRYRPSKKKNVFFYTAPYRKGGKEKAYLSVPAVGSRETKITRWGVNEKGGASVVSAVPLALHKYTAPGNVSPLGWNRLSSSANWHRCHLIHGEMGGPATTWNLVPAPASVNKKMWDTHEEVMIGKVKTGTLLEQHSKVSYHVDSETKSYDHASDFAKFISITYYEVTESPETPGVLKRNDAVHGPYGESEEIRLPRVDEIEQKERWRER
jgi:hypothetical protein